VEIGRKGFSSVLLSLKEYWVDGRAAFRVGRDQTLMKADADVLKESGLVDLLTVS
jgi:hypothetical protein